MAGDEHCGIRLGSRSVRAKIAQGKGSLATPGREDKAGGGGLDMVSDREL